LLSKQDAKLAAKNLKRYLNLAGGFVKSLQNYIQEECYSEEWLKAEELNKSKKQNTNNNKVSTKTLNENYDNID
jgi:hypothetical protein